MDEHSLTRILQQQLRFSSKIKSADAAVLIAITNEENPKVLLTRRSVYLSNHAGEVSFPGGKEIRKIPVISWLPCVKLMKRPH